MAHGASQTARSGKRRAAALLLAVLIGLSGCVRDGGPHPEPPAPLDNAHGGSSGGADNPDDDGLSDAGAVAGGGAGGTGGAVGVGGSAGLGGVGGAGGVGGLLDAGVDAEIEDEDAGPLR